MEEPAIELPLPITNLEEIFEASDEEYFEPEEMAEEEAIVGGLSAIPEENGLLP